MAKRRKKNSSYEARKVAIKKIRRRNWNEDCVYCGKDWHNAKTNAYVAKSHCCVQCMTNINTWCRRGGAAITRRLHLLSKWERRLTLGAGASKKRAVSKMRIVGKRGAA